MGGLQIYLVGTIALSKPLKVYYGSIQPLFIALVWMNPSPT